MNVRPAGAELLHGAWAGEGVDRQTDRRMLPVDFRNFANKPKKEAHKMLIAIL
jgi:hypothetical protein